MSLDLTSIRETDTPIEATLRATDVAFVDPRRTVKSLAGS